jgi:hypothetical protein
MFILDVWVYIVSLLMKPRKIKAIGSHFGFGFVFVFVSHILKFRIE